MILIHKHPQQPCLQSGHLLQEFCISAQCQRQLSLCTPHCQQWLWCSRWSQSHSLWAECLLGKEKSSGSMVLSHGVTRFICCTKNRMECNKSGFTRLKLLVAFQIKWVFWRISKRQRLIITGDFWHMWKIYSYLFFWFYLFYFRKSYHEHIQILFIYLFLQNALIYLIYLLLHCFHGCFSK